MTHPQEIPLVFRTDAGNLLPTRAFHTLLNEARAVSDHTIGNAMLGALNAQIARQATHLDSLVPCT